MTNLYKQGLGLMVGAEDDPDPGNPHNSWGVIGLLVVGTVVSFWALSKKSQASLPAGKSASWSLS